MIISKLKKEFLQFKRQYKNKILLVILFVFFIVSAMINYPIYRIVSSQENENFSNKYSNLSGILGNTLRELEKDADEHMYSVAYYIEEYIDLNGLPSNDDLKHLSQKLHVNHLYITDSNGKFIRSSREDPSLLPNIFSFCKHYKEWFDKGELINPTGLVPGIPAGVASKFLLYGTKDKKYVIEINLEASFLGSTLEKAINNDKNISSLQLLSPNGTSLGLFTNDGKSIYEKHPEVNLLNLTKKNNQSQIQIVNNIAANYEYCCSCIRRLLTNSDNKYFYVLKSTVSTKNLITEQKFIKYFFVIIFIISITISFPVSIFLSTRLAKRIKILDSKVNEFNKTKSFDSKIEIDGSDEIKNLSDNINEMIVTINEHSKNVFYIKYCREFAHNMRTPLEAINNIYKNSEKSLSETDRDHLKFIMRRLNNYSNSILEIKENLNEIKSKERIENILCILKNAVQQFEYAISYKNLKIKTNFDEVSPNIFSNVKNEYFISIISNIINNAAEAIKDFRNDGLIELKVICCDEFIKIQVIDNGKGIDPSKIIEIFHGSSIGKPKGPGLIQSQKAVFKNKAFLNLSYLF